MTKTASAKKCVECEGTGIVKCCDLCKGAGETWQDFHGCNGCAVRCEECSGEPEEVECASCGGSGFDQPGKGKKNETQECYRCHGEGSVPNCRKCKDTGRYFVEFHGCNGYDVECDECDGEAGEPDECERCGGSGKIKSFGVS